MIEDREEYLKIKSKINQARPKINASLNDRAKIIPK